MLVAVKYSVVTISVVNIASLALCLISTSGGGGRRPGDDHRDGGGGGCKRRPCTTRTPSVPGFPSNIILRLYNNSDFC